MHLAGTLTLPLTPSLGVGSDSIPDHYDTGLHFHTIFTHGAAATLHAVDALLRLLTFYHFTRDYCCRARHFALRTPQRTPRRAAAALVRPRALARGTVCMEPL